MAQSFIAVRVNRARQVEVDGFFIIWAFGFLLTLLLSSRQAWRLLLTLVTLLLLFTPLLNGLTTERGLLHSILSVDVLFISFDVMFFILALLFAYITYVVSFKKASHQQKIKSPSRSKLQMGNL